MSSWLGWSSGPRPVQNETDAFWYLNLTAEQQAAYEKFRSHLQQTGSLLSGHDDKWTLLRFLKARQWDADRAAIMYNGMRKWRAEHNTDKLAQTFEFPERDTVLKFYPHFYHKTDRFGRPVYIELLGQTDPHKLLELTSLERLLDYHVCEWEHLKRHILPACSAQAGKPIVTKDVVLDLKGLSSKNFGAAAQKILKTVAHIDQDIYPEHLGQMFIINTPTIFRAVWAMVNPLLEERTRRKIVILGHDYLPTLTQLIPEENLPVILGGKSPLTDTKVEVGPWVGWQAPGDDMQLHKASSDPGPQVLLVEAGTAPASVDQDQALLGPHGEENGGGSGYSFAKVLSDPREA